MELRGMHHPSHMQHLPFSLHPPESGVFVTTKKPAPTHCHHLELWCLPEFTPGVECPVDLDKSVATDAHRYHLQFFHCPLHKYSAEGHFLVCFANWKSFLEDCPNLKPWSFHMKIRTFRLSWQTMVLSVLSRRKLCSPRIIRDSVVFCFRSFAGSSSCPSILADFKNLAFMAREYRILRSTPLLPTEFWQAGNHAVCKSSHVKVTITVNTWVTAKEFCTCEQAP